MFDFRFTKKVKSVCVHSPIKVLIRVKCSAGDICKGQESGRTKPTIGRRWASVWVQYNNYGKVFLSESRVLTFVNKEEALSVLCREVEKKKESEQD